MFHVGLGEAAVIAVVALFVVGPERLPKLAADAGRMLRQFRQMAKSATASVRDELGPEFADVDLTTLNPRTFVRKHLLEDLDDNVVHGGAPTTSPAAQAARAPVAAAAALDTDERPPYDLDAT